MWTAANQEEMAEAAKQYATLWSEEECSKIDELEEDDIREPFKFTFSTIEDMWLFCAEICDKWGYLAYCECKKE